MKFKKSSVVVLLAAVALGQMAIAQEGWHNNSYVQNSITGGALVALGACSYEFWKMWNAPLRAQNAQQNHDARVKKYIACIKNQLAVAQNVASTYQSRYSSAVYGLKRSCGIAADVEALLQNGKIRQDVSAHEDETVSPKGHFNKSGLYEKSFAENWLAIQRSAYVGLLDRLLREEQDKCKKELETALSEFQEADRELNSEKECQKLSWSQKGLHALSRTTLAGLAGAFSIASLSLGSLLTGYGQSILSKPWLG